MHHFIHYICIFYILMLVISSVAVWKGFARKRFVYAYFIISAIFFLYFVWLWNQPFDGVWDIHRQYSFGLFSSWLVFMILTSVVVILETITQLFRVPFRWKEEKKFPPRKRFVSLFGLGIATILFMSMIYGIFIGKYEYRVVEHTLYFDDLPDNFDGYRITHISDIHAGSFDNAKKVQHGIDLINQLKSNVIFFTGDMVNNKAEEMQQWKAIFGQLRAEDGVFSVLGNHDYGDYVQWKSEQEKEKNLQLLKEIQREMGYKLLLNEHHFVEKNGQRIAIIGVENWGQGFIQKGDLQKATSAVKPEDFKLLLSHDPTHWQFKVLEFDKKIHATFSGHTHGMQFGIEIPNLIKWSPVQWRYKYWGGIYELKNRYINVNRGFGYLAFPGRIGMPPEISVIELRKKLQKPK